MNHLLTALISKLNIMKLFTLSISGMAELCLDVLNITMHTEVLKYSMHAYVWCWSKICGSLDEIPSVTMGSSKSKILNEF